MSSKNSGASIVALPSVSSSLYTLPNATSIHNVHIHQHMYAQRAAESEAKASLTLLSLWYKLLNVLPPQLQKCLSKTASAASHSQLPPYQPPSPVSACGIRSPTIPSSDIAFLVPLEFFGRFIHRHYKNS